MSRHPMASRKDAFPKSDGDVLGGVPGAGPERENDHDVQTASARAEPRLSLSGFEKSPASP